MISKNFEFVKDWDKDFYNMISDIEDSFESDVEFILNCGKIIERLLKVYTGNENSRMNFKHLLEEAVSTYRESYSSYFPFSIQQNLKNIYNKRNSMSHDNDDNTYDIIKLSFSNKIHYLNCLWSIFYFFLIEIYNVSKNNLLDFDENVYYEFRNLDPNHQKLNSPAVFDVDTKNIDIEKIKISDFVLRKKNIFFIPEYQRAYTWTTIMCEELFDQLTSKLEDNEDIYFGSMALIIKEDNNTGSREIKIIDGQQRVTTSLIFFRVIFECILKAREYQEIGDDQLPDILFSVFPKSINDTEKINNIKNKINTFNIAKNDMNILKEILTGVSREEINKFINKNQSSQIIINYNKLKELIDEKIQENGISYAIDLFNYYANNYYIACIKFDDSVTNEMEVFENLNSKGQPLETFDLIKNYIYSIVNTKTFKDNGDSLVKELDNYFSLNDCKETPNAEKKNAEYERFFFNYLFYKNIIEKNINAKSIKKNGKSILKCLKLDIGTNLKNIDKSKYSEICNKLGRYFHIYKSVRISDTSILNSNNEFYFVKEELINLKHKDISPILFYLVDQYSFDSFDLNTKQIKFREEYKASFKKCLKNLETYVLFLIQVNGTGQSFKESLYKQLLNYLIKYSSSPSFKEKLPDLMMKWFKQEENSTDQDIKKYLIIDELKMPTRSEIEKALKDKIKDDKISMALMTRLSNYLAKKSKSSWNAFSNKLTIEHIMPKNIQGSWKDSLVSHYSLNHYEIETLHQENLNKLGNLTLLTQGKNSAIGNKNFKEKQEHYKTDNNPLITFEYGINNNNLLNEEYWDFETIEERGSKMAMILLDEIYEIK